MAQFAMRRRKALQRDNGAFAAIRIAVGRSCTALAECAMFHAVRSSTSRASMRASVEITRAAEARPGAA
jgi:hypothetical protein